MGLFIRCLRTFSRIKKDEKNNSFVDKKCQHNISSNLGFIMNKPTIFLKFKNEGIRYGTTLKSIKKESKLAHKYFVT